MARDVKSTKLILKRGEDYHEKKLVIDFSFVTFSDDAIGRMCGR
jgi:anti-anti-sigma regulatory factor